MKAVPRLWPSLAPRVPSGNRSPRWGQAIAGEMFVWLFGIAELVLAITLNIRLAAIVFVAGFIAHFVWLVVYPRIGRESRVLFLAPSRNLLSAACVDAAAGER